MGGKQGAPRTSLSACLSKLVWCTGSGRLRSRTGTLAFMAPEVFLLNFAYKADVWSLGITLYWWVPWSVGGQLQWRKSNFGSNYGLTAHDFELLPLPRKLPAENNHWQSTWHLPVALCFIQHAILAMPVNALTRGAALLPPAGCSPHAFRSGTTPRWRRSQPCRK